MRTIKKLEREFSLYEQLKSRLDMFVRNRSNGRDGIAVDTDHNAI